MTNEQKQVNEKCVAALDRLTTLPGFSPVGCMVKFRSCNASTYEFKQYTVLYSYGTLVAIYDAHTNILYDVLRLVYGYTATSAQHIAKFSSYLFYRNIKRAEHKNNVPPRPVLYRYY